MLLFCDIFDIGIGPGGCLPGLAVRSGTDRPFSWGEKKWN